MLVKIYSKENGSCPYCEKAIDYFTQMMKSGLRVYMDGLINYIKIVRDNDALIQLRDEGKIPREHKTFPAIFFDDKFVGGCDNVIEDILIANPRFKYTFPTENAMRYPQLFQLAKQHTSVFWPAEEIRGYEKDKKDWVENLDETERRFIKHILAFFAGSDAIVFDNIGMNFVEQIPQWEVKTFYSIQSAIEMIHARVYSLLIQNIVGEDDEERARMFNAIETMDAVKRKAEWAMHWMNDDTATLAQKLLAFVCVEGILFSGSFCAIYWLKDRNIMPALIQSNELIARDEGLHTVFGTQLYLQFKNSRLPQSTAHDMIRGAVDVEIAFIVEAIAEPMNGMNGKLMTQYIKYVGDRILTSLGYDTIWNESNPFAFMELISMNCKTNFFEHEVVEYNKAGTTNKNKEDMMVVFDAAF